MNKPCIKKITKGILFILLFCILFLMLQRLFQAKWFIATASSPSSTGAWSEYRSLEEDSLDVLFLGTSHAYSAIDPMYIYENSGITSFVLGGPGLRFDLTWLVLKDALKTQKPSAVFLDMSALKYEEQLDEAKCHKISDQLPITLDKIKYAFDNDNDDMQPLDVLFPFFRYHTRWEELESTDFQYVSGDLESPYERGHFISYKVRPTSFRFYDECDFSMMDRTLEYFQRIAATCEENNIPLVLYKIPAPEWNIVYSEAAADLAEEYNLPYLELYYEIDEIGLDPSTDYRDKNDHMNQYGSEKLCAYLTDYLQANYNFSDKRSQNTQWDTDLAAYLELKQSKYSGS